eukprot:m.161699 g.161699  ORF g.161699 m.161699 type:complete len:65 (+) comp17652_c0_seq5:332-526(+)
MAKIAHHVPRENPDSMPEGDGSQNSTLTTTESNVVPLIALHQLPLVSTEREIAPLLAKVRSWSC